MFPDFTVKVTSPTVQRICLAPAPVNHSNIVEYFSVTVELRCVE